MACKNTIRSAVSNIFPELCAKKASCHCSFGYNLLFCHILGLLLLPLKTLYWRHKRENTKTNMCSIIPNIMSEIKNRFYIINTFLNKIKIECFFQKKQSVPGLKSNFNKNSKKKNLISSTVFTWLLLIQIQVNIFWYSILNHPSCDRNVG